VTRSSAGVGRKPFTALTVLAARDDRLLSLDDPLVRWVPEAAALVYPSRDAPPIDWYC
jgi:CubicO group peptidase (beta-lactamase class C family)